MADIKQVADAADMIVNGYAFGLIEVPVKQDELRSNLTS